MDKLGRKELTKKEAREIVAYFLSGWASMLFRTDEDFYDNIPETYLSDKGKCEPNDYDNLCFYPTEKEKKMIAKEAHFIWKTLEKYKSRSPNF